MKNNFETRSKIFKKALMAISENCDNEILEEGLAGDAFNSIKSKFGFGKGAQARRQVERGLKQLAKELNIEWNKERAKSGLDNTKANLKNFLVTNGFEVNVVNRLLRELKLSSAAVKKPSEKEMTDFFFKVIQTNNQELLKKKANKMQNPQNQKKEKQPDQKIKQTNKNIKSNQIEDALSKMNAKERNELIANIIRNYAK